MTQINEEDKKAEILKEFEQYCNQCDYFNHRIWAYEKMKSLMDKAFAYSDAEIERLRKENEKLRSYIIEFSNNAKEAGQLSFPPEFFTALNKVLDNETERIKAWANHMNETYGKAETAWYEERNRLHNHIKSNTDYISSLCAELERLRKENENLRSDNVTLIKAVNEIKE